MKGDHTYFRENTMAEGNGGFSAAAAAAAKSHQSYPTLCDPWTVARHAPLSMRFSRQEYWSGLPFPLPGYLPNPGSNPCLLHFL